MESDLPTITRDGLIRVAWSCGWRTSYSRARGPEEMPGEQVKKGTEAMVMAAHEFGEALHQTIGKVVALETKVGGLATKVNGLNGKVDGLATKVNGLNGKVDGLATKVNGLNGKVDGLATKMKDLDGKVDGLATKVNDLDGKVDGLETKVDGLDGKVDGLDGKVGGLDTKVGGLDEKLEKFLNQWEVYGKVIWTTLAAVGAGVINLFFF